MGRWGGLCVCVCVCEWSRCTQHGNIVRNVTCIACLLHTLSLSLSQCKPVRIKSRGINMLFTCWGIHPPLPLPLQHYALNFFVFYCPSLSIVFSSSSFVNKFSLSLCLSLFLTIYWVGVSKIENLQLYSKF